MPYAAQELVAAMVDAEYYSQPAETIRSWSELTLDGSGAEPCGDPWPLATWSIGLGVAGVHYSHLARELAVAGFVVAIVDHPYGALSRLPDGTILTAAADPELARVDSDEEILASRTADWTRDISATLDAFLDGGVELPVAVDPDRVFALGHSLGGAAAMDACRSDPRLRACVNMDGAPFGTATLEEGARGNLLVLFSDPLYSDEDLAARGRTREQWDAMGAQIAELWAQLIADGRAEVRRVRVAGTGHLSFSDAPRVMPQTITQFGGKPMAAERAEAVVTAALVGYLREQGGEAGAWDGALRATPELSTIPGSTAADASPGD